MTHHSKEKLSLWSYLIGYDMGDQAAVVGDRRPEGGIGAGLAPSTASRGAAGDVGECCRRLYILARKLELFLGEQAERLSGTLRQCQGVTESSARIQREMAALENHRLAWERKRAEEMRLLEQERDLLTQAWESVEDEQRRLLAERSLLPAAPASASPKRASPAGGRAGGETESSADADQLCDSTGILLDENDTVEERMDPNVTVQFEKVKNDVRRHSLNRRTQ